MEEQKVGKKTGRPVIQVDKEQFEKLCGIQCTLVEVASWFHCSPDTIERWCKRTYKTTFADTYKNLSSYGKISLRRNQFRLAETNTSMAIWLGKQYLGQRDYQDELKSESVVVINNVPKKDNNGNNS